MEIPDEIIKNIKLNHKTKHPQSICIANYKGGVGKTTMSCLIGYYLANKGKKVLLFDIDPQCSLSLAVGFDLGKVNRNDFTIYNLVSPTKWAKVTKVKFNQYVDEIPDKFAPGSLKIVKGSFDVDELDMKIVESMATNKTSHLDLFMYCNQMLNHFDDYDYIIVDCPPNKMFLTQAMLRACKYYITVTIPDTISIYGMPRLLRWVKAIEQESKPLLLGCILNTVNRAGGNEFGSSNQQKAIHELLASITNDFQPREKEVIGDKPILGYIPRLDVISRFLSQGDEKTARFDFKKTTSEQRSVDDVMVNLIHKIEKRIAKYAQA
jgi:chromosome partitioning protein